MYDDIFSSNDMIQMQEMLKKLGQTITTAESCTGGLIASLITEISGSSSVFQGAVVTYCNEVKEQELNVQKQTMINYGAVSPQVVEQMLDGVLKKFNADYAVAVSGVAGPTGGTKDKPVGMVVVGATTKTGEKSIDIYQFDGDRKQVQIQAAKTALKKVFKFIQKSLDK